jgi:hypothetical protein
MPLLQRTDIKMVNSSCEEYKMTGVEVRFSRQQAYSSFTCCLQVSRKRIALSSKEGGSPSFTRTRRGGHWAAAGKDGLA